MPQSACIASQFAVNTRGCSRSGGRRSCNSCWQSNAFVVAIVLLSTIKARQRPQRPGWSRLGRRWCNTRRLFAAFVLVLVIRVGHLLQRQAMPACEPKRAFQARWHEHTVDGSTRWQTAKRCSNSSSLLQTQQPHAVGEPRCHFINCDASHSTYSCEVSRLSVIQHSPTTQEWFLRAWIVA